MNKKIALSVLMLLILFCGYSCKNEKANEQKTLESSKAAVPKKVSKRAEEAYNLVLKWGEEYFKSPKLGTNGKTCNDCHENGDKLGGVSDTYPKYSEKFGKVIQLPHMVNLCITKALKGKKEISFDSTKMISILTYLSTLKGDAKPENNPMAKAALDKAIAMGYKYFHDPKLGSNGRTCSDCHENGEKLHGAAVTFPKYLTMADRVVTLGHMVNYCGYGPLKTKKDILMPSDRMTSMTAYIASFK